MHGALRVLLLLTMLVTWSSLRSAIAQENDGKLRIIVFGGHPDDAKYRAGGSQQRFDHVPKDPKLQRAWLKKRWVYRQSGEAKRFRGALIRFYGPQRGKAIKYAGAFEICEYGRRPSPAELKKLFPFFDRD